MKMIDEYVNSLTRIQGEKDLMKCIEARVMTECGIEAKPFRTVATALWKDQARKVCEELNDKMAAFELVQGDQE